MSMPSIGLIIRKVQKVGIPDARASVYGWPSGIRWHFEAYAIRVRVDFPVLCTRKAHFGPCFCFPGSEFSRTWRCLMRRLEIHVVGLSGIAVFDGLRGDLRVRLQLHHGLHHAILLLFHVAQQVTELRRV